MVPRALQAWNNRASGVYYGVAFVPEPWNVEAAAFYVSLIVFAGALIASLIGWGGRVARVLVLFSYFNLYYPMDVRCQPYDTNIVFFNLLVLCFFPLLPLKNFKPDKLLSSSQPAWPLELIKLNMALVYFSAFFAKIKNSGLSWAQGETLQAYVLERYWMTDNPIAHYVASHLWLCTALSVFTLLAESTFWMVLLPNKWIRFFLPLAGFAMHVGIYAIMSIYFQAFIFTYLVFIPYGRIYNLFIRNTRAGAASPLRNVW
jgi:hypothetical protein